MPTYERWKWCQIESCDAVADNECTASCNHPEGKVSMFDAVISHPRFLCDKHLEEFERLEVEAALSEPKGGE